MLEKLQADKYSAKANREGDFSNLMVTKEDIYKAYSEFMVSGKKMDLVEFFRDLKEDLMSKAYNLKA